MPSNKAVGWHRADIVAAIHKKGSSLTRLGKESGFAASTLRSSLGIRHPRAHAAIAKFLGVPAIEIWPQFYSGEGRSVASKRQSARLRAIPSSPNRNAA